MSNLPKERVYTEKREGMVREAGSGEGFVVTGAFWKTGQRRIMV